MTTEHSNAGAVRPVAAGKRCPTCAAEYAIWPNQGIMVCHCGEYPWATLPPDVSGGGEEYVPLEWEDWSPAGMADRLDQVGMLDDYDDADLKKIAAHLRGLTPTETHPDNITYAGAEMQPETQASGGVRGVLEAIRVAASGRTSLPPLSAGKEIQRNVALDLTGLLGNIENQARNALATTPPGGVREALVEYALHYGPRCRECADNGDICPMSGMACGERRKATGFVIDALIYGAANGHCPASLATTQVQPDDIPYAGAEVQPETQASGGVREAFERIIAKDQIARNALYRRQDGKPIGGTEDGFYAQIAREGLAALATTPPDAGKPSGAGEVRS